MSDTIHVSRRLWAGASAVFFFWPVATHAQQVSDQNTTETNLLSTIVIEQDRSDAAAGYNSAETEGYVAKSTGTGSKASVPIQEIPQSVSVITREQMDDQGAQSTDEALRYTAGVFTQPYGADSDTNWFFLRGFNATQTGVFLDGLQLYGFGFGAFYVDSFNLERIDVLRGPASVLYGGSSPGGIVNYVSKKPTGERFRYLEGGINDAGTAYLGFDIGDTFQDAATNTYDFRVSGRIQGGDGYYDFQDGIRGSVSPSVTWRPNDSTSLTVLTNATIIDERHGAASFLPFAGTVEAASFGRINRDKNYTEPDLDKYLRRQFSVGYEFEHTLENDWTVRQNTRYGYSNLSEFNLYPFGYSGFSPTPVLANPVFSRIVFEHDTTINNILIDNQLEGNIQTGPVEHNLLFGTDYNYFNLDQVQSSAIGTTISVTDPQYGAAQPTPTPYLDQNVIQHRIGVYAQDRLKFGDGWIVTLNGRHDYIDTNATGTPQYSGTDYAFSGRAGLAYEFKNGITPYASVATFFNPLIGSSSLVDFYEPETGEQFEVGVKYQPTWFNGLFTLSYFDLTRRNVVTGPFLFETQIGEVKSRGVEFEAIANLTDEIKLTAAITAYDLEITEDSDASIVGNTPNIVPEQLASLFVDYTFPEGTLEGVTIGGGIRYQGESWVDNANTMKVPSATLFDAKLGYERENWGVDLNVTNIADTRYVSSCDGVYVCSYGEGRSFKLRGYAKW
ncbi:MAG: TonB-dependent siderophore receptor [Pseudomonadota bacterium]